MITDDISIENYGYNQNDSQIQFCHTFWQQTGFVAVRGVDAVHVLLTPTTATAITSYGRTIDAPVRLLHSRTFLGAICPRERRADHRLITTGPVTEHEAWTRRH